MNHRFRHFIWSTYNVVHTNGLAVDVVYGGAFYLQKFLRRYRYWQAERNVVLPEKLWKQRHWKASSSLSTGVTNICNAKCSFCAYPQVVANKTLQTGVMSLEIFKRAVDELAAAGGHNLDLTPVVGDPLVDPGLLDKVDYAVNRAGIKNVMLTTNAILLDRNDTYKKLIDLGIGGVFISTPGASKEVYEEVYGVKRYAEAMSGIHHLLEYNKSKGEPTRVVIRFRNAEKPSRIVRSKDFIANIKPYLSEKVRINFTIDFDNWGGTIRKTDLLGTMRLRTLPRQLDLPCINLFSFSVRHNGSVRLCGCRLKYSDLDDLVVGNILEKSLEEISTSQKTWDIINGFYAGKRPEACMNCTVYQPVNQNWLSHREQFNKNISADASLFKAM